MAITPRLTICIATYNRAAYIGKTIESILSQLCDGVELLIVDGASTDSTAEVAGSYTSVDSRVRYVRLPAKGGVDHDYCRAVELARGEYCWLFTDDDFFKPGAVNEVLAAIDEGHGLIVVNLDVYDPTMQKLLVPSLIKIESDRVYSADTCESLFSDTMHCLTFIGSVVIRRSIWLAREKKKYFGTEFIHVGVIFQKPFEQTVKVIARPLVDYRYGMAQWSARGFAIWMKKWPDLIWSFAWVSSEIREKITVREPWRSLWTLMVQKSLGTYDKTVYRSFLHKTASSKLWKSCALAIAIVPRKLVVWGHYIYCRFRDQTSRDFFQARN